MTIEVAEEAIHGSRLKAVLYLIICAAFTVLGFAMIRSAGLEDRVVGWLSLALFGAGTAVLICTLIRPMTLELDGQGFTLRGGFIRQPRRELWSDITGFHAWRPPQGGAMVGYGYVPGARRPSALRSLNQRMGAEAGLPKGWKLGARAMVDYLNDYRARALGAKASG